MTLDPSERAARRAIDMAMVEMAKAGMTLQSIADQYGVTRERIRQRIKRAGFPGIASAKRKQDRKHDEAVRIARREIACLKRFGCSLEEHQRNIENGIVKAFRQHRHNAHCRGVEFQLTFAQWHEVWRQSGKLNERGRGAEKYCMSRIGDKGAYAVGNVEIKTIIENSREALTARSDKRFVGVFCLYPGLQKPYLAKAGKHRLGFFATEEEANLARLKFIDENPLALKNRLGRGKGWTFINRSLTRPYRMQCGKVWSCHATQEEAEAAYRAEAARQRKAKG